MDRDFWNTIYLDGDYDKDDSYGKWYENLKYVPHIFVRQDPLSTPSTDFTEVYNNPYKDYLLFDRHEEEWFVGWYDQRKDKFLWTAHSLDGDEYLSPSHWLPLPNNPLTNSENE